MILMSNMNFDNAGFLLSFFMLIGVIASSIRGAEKAISAQMDITGVILLAFVTSNGGGTIRDILLETRVFWLKDIYYVWITVIVGVTTFFLIRYRKSKLNYVEFKYFNVVIDSFGVATFALVGIQKALSFNYGITVVLVMSMLTSVGGGLIADIIANEVPVVLCTGLNLTVSVLVSFIYLILIHFMTSFHASLIAIMFTIIFKIISQKYDLNLPK